MVATASYDAAGELASVDYPTGAGNGGNGTSLAAIDRDPVGRTDGLNWNQADGSLLAKDQVTFSQAGRIVDQAIDGTDPYTGGNNFVYDAAGRVTTTHIPGHTINYAFDGTGGCGVLTTAGANTNRTSVTDNGTTDTFCYDHADRLTSTTLAGYSGIAYDTHGNTTTLGDQTLGYDGADRHLRTETTDRVIRYQRDALDRIVDRAVYRKITHDRHHHRTQRNRHGDHRPAHRHRPWRRHHRRHHRRPRWPGPRRDHRTRLDRGREQHHNRRTHPGAVAASHQHRPRIVDVHRRQRRQRHHRGAHDLPQRRRQLTHRQSRHRQLRRARHQPPLPAGHHHPRRPATSSTSPATHSQQPRPPRRAPTNEPT